MIPKIIHYCWFGRNPLPASAKKCIASWRKYLPDYEIWQWSEEPLRDDVNDNEDVLFDKILSFDVNSIPYTKQAYEAKKYAFVSDYARFWILYHEGGLYFDTDVEIVGNMDEIIARGPFMGIEQGASLDGKPMVAPGLGLGVEAGHAFYHKMLQVYANQSYINPDGSQNNMTIVTYTTRELYAHGMKPSEDMQEVEGIWIYPADYFCPMDSTTGIITRTDRTVTIHHYDCSWMDHGSMSFRIHQLKNCIYRMIGQKMAQKINQILH
jgi:mannosyltransferase OCH1-like enzyme